MINFYHPQSQIVTKLKLRYNPNWPYAQLYTQPMHVWMQQLWWPRKPQKVQAPCADWPWPWLDEFLGVLQHANAS